MFHELQTFLCDSDPEGYIIRLNDDMGYRDDETMRRQQVKRVTKGHVREEKFHSRAKEDYVLYAQAPERMLNWNMQKNAGFCNPRVKKGDSMLLNAAIYSYCMSSRP